MPSSSSLSMPPGPSPSPTILIPTSPWNPLVISLVGSICAVFLFLSCWNIIKQNLSLLRRRRPFSSSSRSTNPLGPNHAMSSLAFQRSGGLDSAVLRALPTIQFKNAKAKAGSQTDADCAVCLCQYEEGEWVKSLPDCGHVFHVACIDTWFQSHSSCPLCRSNVGNESDGCCSLSMLPPATAAGIA